jgi:hypothetical protein
MHTQQLFDMCSATNHALDANLKEKIN